MIRVREQGVGKLKWYKRDPVAALEGMVELSFEERGAYNTILDLMYAREGDLADDAITIARLSHSDVRIWKRLRKKLIAKGKLFVHNGKLHNRRADIEIDLAKTRLDNGAKQYRTATSGATSGRSSQTTIPKRTKKQSLSGVTTTTRVPPGGAPPKGGATSFTILNGGEENHDRRSRRLSSNNQTIRRAVRRRRREAAGGDGGSEAD
jgi:uncharacterized protein YdaU (DUF1376 family)